MADAEKTTGEEDFMTLLQAIEEQKLLSATLSGVRSKEEKSLQKITIRPVKIKAEFFYQISEHIAGQVFHRNLLPKLCVQHVEEAFKKFKQGIFTFKESQYHVLSGKRGQLTLMKKGVQAEVCLLPHNRTKNYILQEGTPIPFLIALGIMSKSGQILAKKYDKFRQINRFLEMIKDIIEHFPKDRCLNVIDFGCGKAYLTFALHYYLHTIEKRNVRMKGVDLKKEVIAECNQYSTQFACEGLTFEVGDINDLDSKEPIDLMIALHACDTATDAALEKAVHWNAKVILCVPCCQHELYSQIQSRPLETLLRHGILKERIAALATDAARAELLTMLGYEVQILEFIEMEHTPKNLLLRAVKGTSQEKIKQAEKRYRQFKNELNIFPSLEKRFSEYFSADRHHEQL